MNVDHFTLAYIEALLWSTGDELDGKSIEDFHPDDLAKIKADCRAFCEQNGHLLVPANVRHARSAGSVSEMAGHDFALTRNGHGAGFWDGDWEEAVGGALTESSKAFGESTPYVDDDGLVHLA